MFSARLAAATVAIVFGLAGCAGRELPVRYQAAAPDAASDAALRGQRLAAQACGGCHAIGLTGASSLADATPFREIVHRRSLGELEEGFAAGLVTSHPAMPRFNFRASEIDDLIAYLETVKADS